MSQRITVMMDDAIVTKLRYKQAKRIAKTKRSVSFSRVLNETLSKVLRL